MIIRSLRTRLVLVSTLASGVVIIGVSLLAWTLLVRSARETVDLKLEGISGRIIRDLHPRMNQNRVQKRVRISHGDDIVHLDGRVTLKISFHVCPKVSRNSPKSSKRGLNSAWRPLREGRVGVKLGQGVLLKCYSRKKSVHLWRDRRKAKEKEKERGKGPHPTRD